MLEKLEALRNDKTLQGFVSLGLQDMAYIKPIMIGGQRLHAVHAADGTPLTIVQGRDTAFAAVRQHDLTPQSVH